MKESKAKVTKIVATSRASIHIKDNFYTVEYSEERSIPDIEDVDLNFEREALWADANKIVDAQCEEIIKTFK